MSSEAKATSQIRASTRTTRTTRSASSNPSNVDSTSITETETLADSSAGRDTRSASSRQCNTVPSSPSSTGSTSRVGRGSLPASSADRGTPTVSSSTSTTDSASTSTSRTTRSASNTSRNTGLASSTTKEKDLISASISRRNNRSSPKIQVHRAASTASAASRTLPNRPPIKNGSIENPLSEEGSTENPLSDQTPIAEEGSTEDPLSDQTTIAEEGSTEDPLSDQTPIAEEGSTEDHLSDQTTIAEEGSTEDLLSDQNPIAEEGSTEDPLSDQTRTTGADLTNLSSSSDLEDYSVINITDDSDTDVESNNDILTENALVTQATPHSHLNIGDMTVDLTSPTRDSSALNSWRDERREFDVLFESTIGEALRDFDESTQAMSDLAVSTRTLVELTRQSGGHASVRVRAAARLALAEMTFSSPEEENNHPVGRFHVPSQPWNGANRFSASPPRRNNDLEVTVDLTDSPVAASASPSLDENSPSFPDENSPALASRTSQIRCPVCLDDFHGITSSRRSLMSTVCGHIFCSSCLPVCIRTNGRCPTCRKVLRPNQMHPIFI